MTFSFTLLTPVSSTKFGPRLGNVILHRPDQNATIQLKTPALLATTSRGVVPHLSRDHYGLSSALKWTHIPFETFLEHPTPVPTLQKGTNPLHTFLGLPETEHILSMSARDPNDGRETPTNGHAHVTAQTLRGVRKISHEEWRAYALACKPDVVVALSDTPSTNLPYSQKRLTKSIDRSAAWIASLIKLQAQDEPLSFAVFVQLAGNISISARTAFAGSLLEPLYGPEAAAVKPYSHLDQAVSGYTIDLVPLNLSIKATKQGNALTSPDHTSRIVFLLQASLDQLPIEKPRLVNSTQMPHDILRFISSVGIDLFDAHWAQRAADIGVALDFTFPAPFSTTPRKKNIGHNIYDLKYARDFVPISDSFRGHGSPDSDPFTPICPCAACSPLEPSSRLHHGVDKADCSIEASSSMTDPQAPIYLPSFTRAYVHHLLHTHEMSAHTLLVMHNLAVLESFFAGIRRVLQVDVDNGTSTWAREVGRFMDVYEEESKVLWEASLSWKEVDMARGKGRLARENAK